MIVSTRVDIASEFSALTGDGIYLNSASMGPLPERTMRELDRCNRDRGQPSTWAGERINEILDTSRRLAARLIGAEREEIALMTNTTNGLNVAMRALPLSTGDIVLTFDGEFPSNVYPVLALASQGVILERIPRTAEGWPDEEALLSRVADPTVKAVIVSLTQFANGYTVDLGALSRATRTHDTWLIVDAIQALGQVPVDVRQTPVDFLACGAQKWLLGPWGTGFLYVRRELVERFEPTFAGWASYVGTDDYTQLTAYNETPWPDARRFEVITLPIQDLAGMNASLGLLLEVGVGAIQAHLREVHEPMLVWADRAGVPVTSPRDHRGSGILCIRPPSAMAAHERLQTAGVHCSLREGSIRLSPHLFNTADQMVQVADVIGPA